MNAAELYPARPEAVDDDTSLDAQYCSFQSICLVRHNSAALMPGHKSISDEERRPRPAILTGHPTRSGKLCVEVAQPVTYWLLRGPFTRALPTTAAVTTSPDPWPAVEEAHSTSTCDAGRVRRPPTPE
jgi:hypothetical protein